MRFEARFIAYNTEFPIDGEGEWYLFRIFGDGSEEIARRFGKDESLARRTAEAMNQ